MITCTEFSIDCIQQHSMHSYSLRYLAMFFGSWVNNVFGDGTGKKVAELTPIMAMLGGLNIVSLLYATIVATYRTGHITLNVVATGEAFNRISPYTLLRVAASLALVAPYVQGANSFVGNAQASGMWVITRGVGMADLFNRAGIKEYINSEGEVMKNTFIKSSFSTGEAMTKMLVCTALTAYTGPTRKEAIIKKPFVLITSGGKMEATATVPTMAKVKTLMARAYDADDDESMHKVFLQFGSTYCGQISFDVMLKPAQSESNLKKVAYYANFEKVDQILTYVNKMYKASQVLVSKLFIADLSKYVTKIADLKNPANASYFKSIGLDEFAKTLYDAHATLSYCGGLAVKNAFNGEYKKLSAKECKSSDNSSVGLTTHKKTGSFVDELSAGGWIFTANAFTRLNGLMDVANSQTGFDENNIVSIPNPSKGFFCTNSYFRSWFSGSDTKPKTIDEMVDLANDCRPYWASKELPRIIWAYTKWKANKGDIKPSKSKVAKAADWSAQLALAGAKQDDTQSDVKGATLYIASGLLKSLIYIGYDDNLVTSVEKPFSTNINLDTVLFDSSGRTNAITIISSMGEGLKVIYYMVQFASSTASETAAKLANSGGIFGFFAGIMAKFVSNLLSPLVTASVFGAFIMSTVIPNIPIFTMIFIVVGFFVIAFEAIAGVTFAVALLGSTEGEGLLQLHGARMVSLYASIFLRPTLHTIGFMGGYALCNLSYAILAPLFWGDPYINEMSAFDIFSLIFITGGFPVFLCSLVIYCLKVPNLFANNISSWMATDLVGAFGDATEYMASTQRAFETMTQTFNASMNQEPGNPGKAPEEDKDKNKNDDDPKQIPSSSAK